MASRWPPVGGRPHVGSPSARYASPCPPGFLWAALTIAAMPSSISAYSLALATNGSMRSCRSRRASPSLARTVTKYCGSLNSSCSCCMAAARYAVSSVYYGNAASLLVPGTGLRVHYGSPRRAPRRRIRLRSAGHMKTSRGATRISGLPTAWWGRAEGPAAATIPAGRWHGIQSEDFGVSDEPGHHEHRRDAHQRASYVHVSTAKGDKRALSMRAGFWPGPAIAGEAKRLHPLE
jgi:hypothetical protein